MKSMVGPVKACATSITSTSSSTCCSGGMAMLSKPLAIRGNVSTPSGSGQLWWIEEEANYGELYQFDIPSLHVYTRKV